MFFKKEFVGAVTVGERGQVVIPAAAREALNIKAGDKLLVFRNHRNKGLVLVDAESLAAFLSEAMGHLSEFEKTVSEELVEKAGKEE